MRKPVVPTREDAETVAIRAVAFLAEDPELLRRFLDLSGIGPADLKGRLTDPALLGAVLDFVLFDDRLTCAFAEAIGVAPDLPARARHVLFGASEES